MDQGNLRLEALRMAVDAQSEGETHDDVVSGAEAFYTFLTKSD